MKMYFRRWNEWEKIWIFHESKQATKQERKKLATSRQPLMDANINAANQVFS
jgi:hypothetical protein